MNSYNIIEIITIIKEIAPEFDGDMKYINDTLKQYNSGNCIAMSLFIHKYLKNNYDRTPKKMTLIRDKNAEEIDELFDGFNKCFDKI
jgi:hypothetical protein